MKNTNRTKKCIEKYKESQRITKKMQANTLQTNTSKRAKTQTTANKQNKQKAKITKKNTSSGHSKHQLNKNKENEANTVRFSKQKKKTNFVLC